MENLKTPEEVLVDTMFGEQPKFFDPAILK